MKQTKIKFHSCDANRKMIEQKRKREGDKKKEEKMMKKKIKYTRLKREEDEDDEGKRENNYVKYNACYVESLQTGILQQKCNVP